MKFEKLYLDQYTPEAPKKEKERWW